MSTLIQEITGSKEDKFYKKFILVGWDDCNEEEKELYATDKKRNTDKDKVLYLAKVVIRDSNEPLFAVILPPRSFIDLLGEVTSHLLFAEEGNAINYIRNELEK